MMNIKIWIQMFFEDGSVSEAKRVPAEILDDMEKVKEIGMGLLRDLNRIVGYMLIWGAGNMLFMECEINACPSEESKTLALEPWFASSHEHKSPES